MKTLGRPWFRSITTRMLLVLLLFIVPAAIASTLITYRIFWGMLQQQNEETTISSFTRIEDRIDDLLRNANLAVSSIQNYPDVDNYILNTFSNDIDKTTAKQKMIDAIDEAFTPYNFLNAVIFFKPDGSMCGSSLPQTFFYEKNNHPFTNTPAYAQAKGSESSGILWTGGYSQNYFSRLPQAKPLTSSNIMICGLKTVHYYFSYDTPQENASNNVVVLFSIDEGVLRQTFSYIADKNSYVCLLDTTGKQLSGDNVGLFGKIPWYYKKINPKSKYGSIVVPSQNGNYQVVYNRLSSTGWLLVETTPIQYYTSRANKLQTLAFIVGFGMVIIIGGLYLVWTFNFTKPVKSITLSLEKVKKGDLTTRITGKSNTTEFELMGQQFNQMLDSINDLIVKSKQMEREKMALEMRSLQNQINPHFIYNTITAIRWMATISGSANVADMLVVFTGLLRPVFSQKESEWPLEEEIRFLENYVTLMRLRYGNNVAVNIILPEDLKQALIPRFILQPLLENCFEHGGVPDKVIQVNMEISQEQGYILIRVCDNGKGIPSQQLREINRKLAHGEPDAQEPQNGQASIGLANVHRRLQLYYGNESSLSVEDAPGGGTSIIIRIEVKPDDKR